MKWVFGAEVDFSIGGEAKAGVVVWSGKEESVDCIMRAFTARYKRCVIIPLGGDSQFAGTNDRAAVAAKDNKQDIRVTPSALADELHGGHERETGLDSGDRIGNVDDNAACADNATDGDGDTEADSTAEDDDFEEFELFGHRDTDDDIDNSWTDCDDNWRRSDYVDDDAACADKATVDDSDTAVASPTEDDDVGEHDLKRIRTNRGGEMVVFLGYRYHLDNVLLNGVESRKCVLRTCGGRIHVDGSDVYAVSPHNHDPDPAACKVAEARGLMRVAAVDHPAERPRGIISRSIGSLTQAEKAFLPTKRTMAETIRKRRKAAYGSLINATALADWDIPKALVQLPSGESFLKYDSGPNDPNRFLVFGSNAGIEFLQGSSAFMVDGTFDAAPKRQGIRQLLIVEGKNDGHVAAGLFCLLPGKSERLYDKVFDTVHGFGNMRPADVSCDFEKGLINSLRRRWPDANICGDLFHLAQSVRKRTFNKMKLSRRYHSDDDMRLRVKFLWCLAYVPPHHVRDAFAEIDANAPAELRPLYDYFCDTYIGRFLAEDAFGNPPVFSRPLFDLADWNVYTRPREQKDAVSNGHIEALNCQINKHTSSDPSMRETIQILLEEHEWASVTYSHAADMDPAPPSSKPCVDRHNALVRCMESFDPNEPIERYLLRIERKLRLPSGYVAHRPDNVPANVGNGIPRSAGRRRGGETLFGLAPRRANTPSRSRRRGRLIGRARATTSRTDPSRSNVAARDTGPFPSNMRRQLAGRGRRCGRGRRTSTSRGQGTVQVTDGAAHTFGPSARGSSPPSIDFDNRQQTTVGHIGSLFGAR